MSPDAAKLELRVNRLAIERSSLFDKANAGLLSDGERQRLHTIELELDQCFVQRRQQRAARDARRFGNDAFAARAMPDRQRS